MKFSITAIQHTCAAKKIENVLIGNLTLKMNSPHCVWLSVVHTNCMIWIIDKYFSWNPALGLSSIPLQIKNLKMYCVEI